MKFNFNNENKDYEVEIIDQGERGIKIIVNGKDFFYGGSEESEPASVPQTIIPKRDLLSKDITAVLAGTVSEISVKNGDIINPGQKVLTLSAMKMENEILSDCKGKIKEIKVKEGEKVKEGDVLVVLI